MLIVTLAVRVKEGLFSGCIGPFNFSTTANQAVYQMHKNNTVYSKVSYITPKDKINMYVTDCSGREELGLLDM